MKEEALGFDFLERYLFVCGFCDHHLGFFEMGR